MDQINHAVSSLKEAKAELENKLEKVNGALAALEASGTQLGLPPNEVAAPAETPVPKKPRKPREPVAPAQTASASVTTSDDDLLFS